MCVCVLCVYVSLCILWVLCVYLYYLCISVLSLPPPPNPHGEALFLSPYERPGLGFAPRRRCHSQKSPPRAQLCTQHASSPSCVFCVCPNKTPPSLNTQQPPPNPFNTSPLLSKKMRFAANRAMASRLYSVACVFGLFAGLASAASLTGPRLLVVLEDADERAGYSQFFGDLEGTWSGNCSCN